MIPPFRSESNVRPAANGVIHEDNMQCQFNSKTHKIDFIVNASSIFYRRGALIRAKQVC